jgi:hypothetical protein
VFEDAPVAPTGSDSDATVHSASTAVVFDLVNDPLAGLVFVGPGVVDLKTHAARASVTVTGTDVTVTAIVPATDTNVTASPQPDPDPAASTDPIVNNAVDTASSAQGTLSAVGTDTTGVVGVDSTTVDTVVDAAGNATGTSSTLNEVHAYVDNGDGPDDPHTYPSSVCKDNYYNPDIRYPETYVTYSYNAWVTIGELHVPSDTVGNMTYQTSKLTSIGVGWNYGDGWSVSGTSKSSRTQSGWNGWTYGSGTYGRHIKAKFLFHDTRTYYCKGSSKGSVVFDIIDERQAIQWTYDITAGSTDLRNWDSKTRFDQANSAGRAQRFYKNNTPGKASGDGYNYTFETCVLGLCVGSETDFATTTQETWDFKGNRDYYWLFGNDNKPLVARITYAYG